MGKSEHCCSDCRLCFPYIRLYAVFFVIQWHEPLTYLSTLPALFTGIVTPLVNKHYERILERLDRHYTHALTMMEDMYTEMKKRKEGILDDLGSDISEVPS
jgi:hypothetical protein